MNRRWHNLVTTPRSRNVRISPWSPQLNGLVSAWFYTPFGWQTTVKDLMGINDAIVNGTYSWQETDNELGSGIWTAGNATGYTDCGNDASIQVASTGLTLSIWIRMYQNLGTTNFPGLIGKGDADSNTLGSYILYLTTGPKLNFLIWSGSARVNYLTGATSLDFQRTYNLVATWSPSVRTSIFINGVRDATTTTSVPATLDNPNYDFILGANQGGANPQKYQFRGMIFEARVYKRALTDDEVWQLWGPSTRWNLYLDRPTRGHAIPSVAPAVTLGSPIGMNQLPWLVGSE